MSFSRPGAIDLSALKSQPAGSGPAAPAGGAFVIDATEQNLQSEVLEASKQYVVVLNLWSPRAQQSAGFNVLIANVANSYGGQILLANVDVDANPSIAQAVGAQGVPFVIGLIMGQPVPMFQSTVEEAELRQVFDQLVQAAAQNGLTGRAAPVGTVAPEPADEPEDDPRFAEADAALAEGNIDAAIAAYESLVAQNPSDAEVAERLAGVRLMARTADADLQVARTAAADNPDDLGAQLLVADLDVSGGHVEDAFDRLIALIRRTTDEDRERIRERLIELFTIVGTDDPRVAVARRALATALF